MEYKYPLTAINRDRSTVILYTFEDVRAFYKKNGWWGEEWQRTWCYWWSYGVRNPHPSIPWNYSRHTEPTYYQWIIRDEWGRKVKPTDFDFSDNTWREKRYKKIRHAEELGLPIPGTGGYRKCWKMDHMAKKNSGKGKRNRDRALCEYERKEYGIKNPYGGVRPWEGY